ncbi:MAG TPA: hypothetical protein PLX84_15270, partial [Acidiphilium sp.]|nr:hypothetical protein [Acidiphilium sp.]
QVTGMGSDGDNDGSAGKAGGNSPFASALMNALSQSGISVPSGASSSSTSSSTTQSPDQALQAFMQNLFAALRRASR